MHIAAYLELLGSVSLFELGAIYCSVENDYMAGFSAVSHRGLYTLQAWRRAPLNWAAATALSLYHQPNITVGEIRQVGGNAQRHSVFL